jgi:hypothetical protein
MRLVVVDPISRIKKLNFEHKNGIFEERREEGLAKVVRGEEERRRKE